MRKAFQSSRGAWRLAVAIASAIVAAGCSAASVLPARSVQGSTKTVPHLTHIVIVIQENRTFDNLFWDYPGADSSTTCALDQKGQCVPMIQVSLYEQYDLDHSPMAFATDYDGGKLDGWDKEGTDAWSKTGNHYYAYQYTQQSDTVPYWQMAERYALADRMFQSNGGPSFPAHQYLIAGKSGYNDNPKGSPWGCDGLMPECFNYQTLGDLMDSAGVSWRYYSPGGDDVNQLSIWEAYDAISHIRYGRDWTNGDQATDKQFFMDVAGGNLPQVSWVVPTGPNSDHPGAGAFGTGRVDEGPAWVASVVDAIGQSPYWQNTAIIVTWDDWGGWYDHVPPQQLDANGLGMRVPLIIVSPYAQHGYVSHVDHEFGSILKFTEETFSLGSLGTVDQRSNDLSDMFDFSQQPSGFSPFAHGTFDINDTSPPDDD
jgi:phospholipase C